MTTESTVTVSASQFKILSALGDHAFGCDLKDENGKEAFDKKDVNALLKSGFVMYCRRGTGKSAIMLAAHGVAHLVAALKGAKPARAKSTPPPAVAKVPAKKIAAKKSKAA